MWKPCCLLSVHTVMEKITEIVNPIKYIQYNILFFLQASFTLPLSVLKSFLGGKVQQHGVLLQIYNTQL